MAHEESKGHVTDDVTWPQGRQVVTPTRLESNIAKTAGDATAIITR